jgi:signal transduction histidine kinase
LSVADLDAAPIADVIALPRVATEGPANISQYDSYQIRSELARELHDQVAQNLTSLLVQARLFARIHQHDREVVTQFAYVHTSVFEALNNVRRILSDLRGQPALDGDLVRAVRDGLVASFKGTRMKVTLIAGRSWPTSVPPETGIHIYRIIQEALTNAQRHGRARFTEVHMRATANLLVCTVRDDGSGIACADESKPLGMGILGMKERAAILGGVVTIRNRPRQGTTLTASFAKEVVLWQSTPRPSAS